MSESKMTYQKPELTVIGTVSHLTRNDTAGPLSDAAIPNNQPVTLS